MVASQYRPASTWEAGLSGADNISQGVAGPFPEVYHRGMDKAQALQVYEAEGAVAAASAAGTSLRTVQRWASMSGVRSGYKKEPTVPCPSRSAYGRGCRCEGCTDANRVHQAAGNDERRERLHSGQTNVVHGRISTYSNWSCRCGECSAAWSVYMRARRNGPNGS